MSGMRTQTYNDVANDSNISYVAEVRVNGEITYQKGHRTEWGATVDLDKFVDDDTVNWLVTRAYVKKYIGNQLIRTTHWLGFGPE